MAPKAEISRVLDRVVQKHGGSLILTIGKEECKVKNIEEGDIITFEIKEVKKK